MTVAVGRRGITGRTRRRGCRVAARGARAADGEAADHWVFGPHTRLLDSQRPVAFVERLRDVET
jgi:hypothetical protein